MDIQGTWKRDEEGFMEFEPAELQRLYEAVTDAYHRVYNRYLEESDDDDAYYKALEDGYEMVTDYKTINDSNEFVTTYITPTHMVDIWYEVDPITEKRVYDKGFIRIITK